VKCPACDSDNTRRYRVIFDEGTTETEASERVDGDVSGVTFSAGGSGNVVGTYSGTRTTTATSQTKLAAACSPPARGGSALGAFVSWGLIALLADIVVAGAVIVAGESGFLDQFFGAGRRFSETEGYVFLGLVALLLVVVLLAGLVVGFRRARKARAYHRDVYPRLMARWQRSWMCMRCGKGFEAGE